MWYTTVGPKHGMNPTLEAMFYDCRSVVLMEHVVAAFCMLADSTSFDVHIKEVELQVKSMIKLVEGSNAMEVSMCGDYFVLNTRNKRTLHYDVNQQMGHLGPGLTSQILNLIERG